MCTDWFCGCKEALHKQATLSPFQNYLFNLHRHTGLARQFCILNAPPSNFCAHIQHFFIIKKETANKAFSFLLFYSIWQSFMISGHIITQILDSLIQPYPFQWLYVSGPCIMYEMLHDYEYDTLKIQSSFFDIVEKSSFLPWSLDKISITVPEGELYEKMCSVSHLSMQWVCSKHPVRRFCNKTKRLRFNLS